MQKLENGIRLVISEYVILMHRHQNRVYGRLQSTVCSLTELDSHRWKLGLEVVAVDWGLCSGCHGSECHNI